MSDELFDELRREEAPEDPALIRRAERILERHRDQAKHPRLAVASRVYDRVVEPTLLAAVAIVHLAWTAIQLFDLLS